MENIKFDNKLWAVTDSNNVNYPHYDESILSSLIEGEGFEVNDILRRVVTIDQNNKADEIDIFEGLGLIEDDVKFIYASCLVEDSTVPEGQRSIPFTVDINGVPIGDMSQIQMLNVSGLLTLMKVSNFNLPSTIAKARFQLLIGT